MLILHLADMHFRTPQCADPNTGLGRTVWHSPFKTCWKQKIAHDDAFKATFEGVQNSKDGFKDQVLSEKGVNASALTVMADFSQPHIMKHVIPTGRVSGVRGDAWQDGENYTITFWHRCNILLARDSLRHHYGCFTLTMLEDLAARATIYGPQPALASSGLAINAAKIIGCRRNHASDLCFQNVGDWKVMVERRLDQAAPRCSALFATCRSGGARIFQLNQ